MVGRLLEELLRVVACGFGFGEGSGESVEGGVFDDLLHVIGNGPAYLADVSVHGLLGRPVLGEGGQGCGCGLFVGGLEVEQGLLGGADLLVVVAELVPAGGGDDDQNRGVEEHCQGGAVLGSGLAEHGAYGAPQCSGVMMFGPDAGAGGPLERGRRLTELGAQVLGCKKGKAPPKRSTGGPVLPYPCPPEEDSPLAPTRNTPCLRIDPAPERRPPSPCPTAVFPPTRRSRRCGAGGAAL